MTLVASVVADVTCRLLLGGAPVFRVDLPSSPALASLPLYLALGWLAVWFAAIVRNGAHRFVPYY